MANGFSTIFIKDKPVFTNGSKSIPRNPPYLAILFSWVFDNFILADELFAKTLGRVETFVLANNNLCVFLYSLLELPITFHEKFKVTSLTFFLCSWF